MLTPNIVDFTPDVQKKKKKKKKGREKKKHSWHVFLIELNSFLWSGLPGAVKCWTYSI